MTLRLYYDQPYLTEFKAKIISQEETTEGWNVILDQTAFYPEGGGQAGDTGLLNRQPLLKLSKNEQGDIIHTVKNRIETEEVTGKIDWEKRFVHMQQHSGQHVLSAAIYLLFGVQTVQAKFDSNEGWISLARALSQEEISLALQKANSIVFGNLPITTKFISLEEMENYSLVKTPKEKFSKEGNIRIWHIPNYYTIPCGGTHVKNTGEIGTVFITKQIKEGDLTKLFFTTGLLTLSYAQNIQTIQRDLGRILETTQKDIVHVAEKVVAQGKILQKQLEETTKQLAITQAKALPAKNIGNYSIYQTTYSQDNQTVLRPLLFALTKSSKTIAIATAENLPLVIACSGDTSPQMLLRLKELQIKYQGKGGGTLTYWQGVIAGKQEFTHELLSLVAGME